jgi:hypothetical protein
MLVPQQKDGIIYVTNGNNVEKKYIGEQSALRNYNLIGGFTQSYKDSYVVDKTEVNYSLCRQLYLNSHENYKLGAGFAKPIVNSIVAFMGVPTFLTEDVVAEEVIKQYLLDIQNTYIKIQRNMLREGDCYVLVTNQKLNNKLFKNELKIGFEVLLPERVQIINDEYGEMEKVIIKTTIDYLDENDNKIQYKVAEVWTNDSYNKTYSIVNCPDYIKNKLIDKIMPNPYGFIPVLHFKNEHEEFRKTGTSELESVEPYMRAYHEVMLDSLRSTKLNSSPKLKIKVANLQQFLANNFTSEEIANKQLKLSKKDVLFVGDEDDLGYVEVSATNHSVLLELLFMCIVDTSETPEFLFGTAVASSKASVGEQMTPLMKKIARKRSAITDSYQLMARMVFAIYNDNNLSNLINDFQTKIIWEDTDSIDDKIKAETINTVITALNGGIEGKIISYESAINYLKQYIETMSNTYEEEKEKILTQYEEMADGLNAELNAQIEEILNAQQNNTTSTNNPQIDDNNPQIDEGGEDGI